MAGGEKGHAGKVAESAGAFLEKAFGVYEGVGYWSRPLEGGVFWWLHTGLAKGSFVKGFKGGLLVAMGITFVREFLAGGGGH